MKSPGDYGGLFFSTMTVLRHQLGVPNLNSPAFKILDEVEIVLRHLQKRILRPAIGRH